MPDTLPDIEIPFDDWINVEAATGITTGSALIIQNKGADGVLLAIQTAKPDADSTDGPQIYQAPYPLSTITVDDGENAVWLKSTGTRHPGKANIQIGTATGGGGGVTVQSDWDQTDDTQNDYIRNKPTALSEFTNDLSFVETVTSSSPLITVDSTDAQNPVVSTTATRGMITQDQGVEVDADATTLNFTGDLVTAADTGGGITQVSVNSAILDGTFARRITTQDSGTQLTDNTRQFNFVGGGITASASGGNVTVTVPTIPQNASQLNNDSVFVESVTVGSGPISVDNSDRDNPILSSTAIEGIRIEEDGTTDVATATAINFTGDAVNVTDAGSGEATVNIDTSNFASTFSAPITVQEEGVNVATAVDQINFVGAATATATGNDITVTIPEIPDSTSDLTNDSLVASVVAVAPGIAVDNTDPRNPRISTTAITGVRVEEEGVSTVASANALNFVGDNVTVTDGGGNEATITITAPSGGNDISISEEGTELTSAVESINFLGSATATVSGNAVTVNVPNIPTDISELSNTSVVESVVAGTGVTVDNTDPLNPIINASGGAGFTVLESITGDLVTSSVPAGLIGDDTRYANNPPPYQGISGGMCYDHDNDHYYIATNVNYLIKTDSSFNIIDTMQFTGLSSTTNIAYLNGKVYLCDIGGANKVGVVDTATFTQETTIILGGTVWPEASDIVATPDGKLWVAELKLTAATYVEFYEYEVDGTPTGNTQQLGGFPNAAFQRCRGVTYHHGRWWWGRPGVSDSQTVITDGTITYTLSNGSWPNVVGVVSLVFNQNTLYISDASSNVLKKYNINSTNTPTESTTLPLVGVMCEAGDTFKDSSLNTYTVDSITDDNTVTLVESLPNGTITDTFNLDVKDGKFIMRKSGYQVWRNIP